MVTIVKVLSTCLLFLSADKLRVALSLTGVAFFNTDVVFIFCASKDYLKQFETTSRKCAIFFQSFAVCKDGHINWKKYQYNFVICY